MKQKDEILPVISVDEAGSIAIVGSADRQSVHSLGLLHLTVIVFCVLVNCGHRILCTDKYAKYAAKNAAYGLEPPAMGEMWDLAGGGHLPWELLSEKERRSKTVFYQTVLRCAGKEMEEETGLVVDRQQLVPLDQFHYANPDGTNSEYSFIFAYPCTGSPQDYAVADSFYTPEGVERSVPLDTRAFPFQQLVELAHAPSNGSMVLEDGLRRVVERDPAYTDRIRDILIGL